MRKKCSRTHTHPDLSTFLTGICARPNASEFVRMSTLCTTLTGNKVPLLTITNFKSSVNVIAARKAICLTARVHPGETCASWAMQGLLDFLCGSTGRAKILRGSFIFKVVPMLNPDGVIAGQYRCSLAGNDLNRQWATACPRTHPTIHATRSLIKTVAEQRHVVLYCDLHGHSRKCNMFMYGCTPRESGVGGDGLMERIWPYLLHTASPLFEYDDCTFKVEKSKEGSARVVVWKEAAVTNSYTLEMSLGGGYFGALTPRHYEVADYVNMGQLLCFAMLDLFEPGKVKVNSVLSELTQMHPDVTRKAEERGARESAKAGVEAHAFKMSLAHEKRETNWKVPDALPKDLMRVPKSVATLKSELPSHYTTQNGKTVVKAKVATGAKAVPKKKLVKKPAKKAGYG